MSKRLKAQLLWSYVTTFVGTGLAVVGAIIASGSFQEEGPAQFVALAGDAVFLAGASLHDVLGRDQGGS